ncbi:MAG: uracil-DNA glycosylase [Opitutaceae bacterium]
MHASLHALTAELKRLKASGVKSLPVSDESLAMLKVVLATRGKSSLAAAPPTPTAAAVPAKSEPAVVPVFQTPTRTFTVKPAPAPEIILPDPVPFTLPPGDKGAQWADLKERVLTDPVCRGQVKPGKQIVFGVGSLDAKIMFVGEAPGADEEVEGEPFVGAAGQLLNKMITAMGLKRADVYISNIMNWRPALPADASGVQYGNRPPTPRELAYCLPYLKAQIEVVKPALLVALGSTAAHGLLGAGTFKTLGEIRGQWKEFAGNPLMVTYHPSYILRNQSNQSKRLIWEDLLKVMERAALPVSDKQRGFFLDRG